MDIKIIKSEKELDAALVRMGKLMELNPTENSKEAEEIKLLGLIIKDYEEAHYPTPPSDPIEAIKFMMEQNDLRPSDMKNIFGTTSRYYEVINRKRALSLNMMKGLHVQLHVSYDILMNETVKIGSMEKVGHRKLHV